MEDIAGDPLTVARQAAADMLITGLIERLERDATAAMGMVQCPGYDMGGVVLDHEDFTEGTYCLTCRAAV